MLPESIRSRLDNMVFFCGIHDDSATKIEIEVFIDMRIGFPAIKSTIHFEIHRIPAEIIISNDKSKKKYYMEFPRN